MGAMTAVIDWLMEGDPAIRWQVQRDLLDRAESTWKRERAKVATHGWGAELLQRQDPDGGWGNAVYSPKWTSTHYTLLQLVRMGLPPSSRAGRRGVERLYDAARYQDGAVNFARTVPHPDECVNGMVLLMASYFGMTGPPTDGIAEWLTGQVMDDGGFNCELWRGATHGSFHTTISVLEGFEAYLATDPPRSIARPAQKAVREGREFLLRHRLYQSHRTGEVADRAFIKLSFPPRWHYDILRGLEYFASTTMRPEPRCGDAIEILRRKRRPSGMWPLQNRHQGRLHFTMEQGGQPSRWNTLRALRVLRWWAGS